MPPTTNHEKDLHAAISKIFVKWKLPTRQVAISELVQLFGGRLESSMEGNEKELREKIVKWADHFNRHKDAVTTSDIDFIMHLFTRALQRQVVDELEDLRRWLFNRGGHQGCPDWRKVYNHIVGRRDKLTADQSGGEG